MLDVLLPGREWSSTVPFSGLSSFKAPLVGSLSPLERALLALPLILSTSPLWCGQYANGGALGCFIDVRHVCESCGVFGWFRGLNEVEESFCK